MPDGTQIAAMQRARGRVALRFAGERHRLVDLHQSGCLKAMMPRNHTAEPDVVLINTAGGLTGGDHLNISASVETSARLNIATQTAERVYKSTGPMGRVSVDLTIGAGGAIHWMPQETILFDRSALGRSITVDMQDTSELLIVEPLIFGRRAMGETLSHFSISDQWCIRRSSRIVHAEATRFEGGLGDLSGLAALGDCCAVATILFVKQGAETRLDEARAILPDAAFSATKDRLIGRLAASDPRLLRGRLIHFLTRFRSAPMPRVWTM